MSKKCKKFIFKHQFNLKDYLREFDTSTKTIPDLVLSMRDVYHKYVQTGTLEGIAISPLIQDDRLMDELPEETVDTLMMSKQLRESAMEEYEARHNNQDPKPEPEPTPTDPEPEPTPTDPEPEPE